MDCERIDDELNDWKKGCAMKVHATLRNGFQEVIHQRTLSVELRKKELQFARDLALPIY
jgi:GxxExxY protein